jgi:site-specific recombinase XerD
VTTKGITYPIELLTPADVDALLGATSRRGPTGIRDRALMAVLYRGMLRLGEALALHPRDLTLESGDLNVRRGKGAKQRMVALDSAARAFVEAWLVCRRELGITGRAPLFCTISEGVAMHRGEPLKQQAVRAALKRYARCAGVEKRVHPHGFRHTRAAELMAEGKPVNVVQKALGHSSTATTARYVDHIQPTQVLEAMRESTWVPAVTVGGRPRIRRGGVGRGAGASGR